VFWIFLVVATLLGAIVGAVIQWRVGKVLAEPMLHKLRRALADDEVRLLSTFRRELANFMVRTDPERFFRLHNEARATQISIGDAEKIVQLSDYRDICVEFPSFGDFDLVGTREYVLYADGLSYISIEEIEAHYLKLVKFDALTRALDEDWELFSFAIDDEEVAHLERYVQRIKDAKFLQRFKSAIVEFKSQRSDDAFAGGNIYETGLLSVCRIVHRRAEVTWGFHFKDTNEYGIYGEFTSHERDKLSPIYHRSDKNFEMEELLDPLNIDDPI
jgi:hypothetical protein